MTLHTNTPNPNSFVRFARKIYSPVGFKKGYNFILWFIFAGALTGFELARLPSFNVNGYWRTHDAPPGDWYWLSRNFYNIGLHMHLICIIPAGLLAVLQFTPIIRYKALIFHRANGYLVLLLFAVSNVGALMITRRAFGGTLATQTAMGVLALSTTTSFALSYYNIKRLQIEQHRAWMLRGWFYAGSIITLRIIQIIIVHIISRSGLYFQYYQTFYCQHIVQTGGPDLAASFVSCVANPEGVTAVQADFNGNVMQTGAALQLSFDVSAWLAFVIHAAGIEAYLHLTPAETERLRKVSYEKQLDRGFKNPGSAGLTADRLGDAEQWTSGVQIEKRITLDSDAIDDAKLTVPLVGQKSRNGSASSNEDISRPGSSMGQH